MGFLTPLALTLSALALPIIIFYMLKLRRQPARVSSLLLWQQVIQDRQANAPWQRLRRNLLLLLQLLILALLVLALARPYFIVEARVQGNVVLLLDASASMQATDVAPSRFAAAQAEAQALIDRLGPDDAVTLIAVEHTPRVLASTSTDREAIRRSLSEAQATNSPADWEAALTLAAANAAARPNTNLVIVSDGGLAQPGADRAIDLSRLPVPVEVISLGQGADNQGLVSLALRDGPDGPEVFLRVANAAGEARQRRVEFYVDDHLFDARDLELPPQASASLTLTGLPLGARYLRASLAGPDDLAADDVAWLVRSSAPARVLLVSPGNLFLERALALLPNVTVERALPDQELPAARFEAVIFDRTLPAADTVEALPEANLLFIAPPASTPLFEVKGPLERPRPTRLERTHPLLEFVELNTLNIAAAQAVVPPPWGQTLIDSRSGPLLIAGQPQGRRVAILTFDLFQSDLPLQIDFPILIVNLSRWLLPSGGLAQGQMLQAGQRVDLPVAAAAEAFQIRTPSGQSLAVSLNQPAFHQTGELGLYQILAQESNQSSLLSEFAVNLLSEAETNTRPQVVTVAPAAEAASQSLTGRWEWWWLPAGLGLVVLLLEWWVYWRGEGR